jgi:alanyl-tRNA synthetase
MLKDRAHRLGRVGLGLEDGEPSLASLVPSIEEAMRGSPYEEWLVVRRQTVQRAIEQEEQQFLQTLEAGTSRLEELIAAQRKTKRSVISGGDAFKLYDTYGFPLELTVDMAQEHQLTVDRAGFESALAAQQARSRAGSQFSGGIFVHDDLRIRETVKDLPSKEELFIGYERLEDDALIKGLWDGSG